MGFFLIILLPILGGPNDLLFPLGKLIIFRIITEILFIFYLVLIILNPVFRPKFSPILIFVVLFWVINGISTIFSPQPVQSFWSERHRGLGFFTQTHFLLFFIMLISIVKEWIQWKKIMFVAIMGSLGVFFVSLVEYFILGNMGTRIISSLYNPNFLGAYILLIFFITLLFILIEKRPFSQENKNILAGSGLDISSVKNSIDSSRTSSGLKKPYFLYFLYLIGFLQLVVLFLTFSRGAFLGLFFGGIIFLFLIRDYFRIPRNCLIFGIFLILIFAIFLTTGVVESLSTVIPQLKSLPHLASLDDTGRTSEYWRAGILGIKDRPFFGFGPENFSIPFDKYYQGTLDNRLSSTAWVDRAHNFIVDTVATTGLVGLLAFFGMWVAVFITLFKATKYKNFEFKILSYALVATFISYFVQNSFNLDTDVSVIYIFLWLGLTISLANGFSVKHTEIIKDTEITNDTKINISNNKLTTSKKVFILIIILTTTPLFIYSFKNYHLDHLVAQKLFNQTERLYLQGRYKETFELLHGNLEKWTPINFVLQQKYAAAIYQFSYTKEAKGDIEQTKKLIKLEALPAIEKIIKERPYYTRIYGAGGFLANRLIEMGETQYKSLADQYFSKAQEISPNRSVNFIEWSKTDILIGDYEKAEEKLKKAININSRVKEAHWWLGVTYLYLGDKELAKKEFIEMIILNQEESRVIISYLQELPPLRLAHLTKIYSETEDYEELIEVLKVLIKNNPQNVQSLEMMAKAYEKVQDFKKAEEINQRILEIYSSIDQRPVSQ